MTSALTSDSDTATTLTADQLNEMRAEARRRSAGLIDPCALNRIGCMPFYPEWATAVLGRDFPGVRWLHSWEITLLDMALDAEPNRPTPAAVRERQEKAREDHEALQRAAADAYAAKEAAWRQLRDRLPITVSVGHNWTLGHWESGYQSGREHIVAQEDLYLGRLRRKAKQVFCETPAKVTSGRRNKDPLRGVDRDDDGEDRIPTCKACLKVAERIARPTSKINDKEF
ncbi:hypothetical protein [Streptosporangium sp. NPDC051022]|uniref:hypothetical protein n=1 Tax=Streptosporangium sp. NPDC051022 TaxID=3155752 RepID=UPI00342F8E8C